MRIALDIEIFFSFGFVVTLYTSCGIVELLVDAKLYRSSRMRSIELQSMPGYLGIWRRAKWPGLG